MEKFVTAHLKMSAALRELEEHLEDFARWKSSTTKEALKRYAVIGKSIDKLNQTLNDGWSAADNLDVGDQWAFTEIEFYDLDMEELEVVLSPVNDSDMDAAREAVNDYASIELEEEDENEDEDEEP